MGIGFIQNNDSNKGKKTVQQEPGELFLTLLRENFSPEETTDYPEVTYLSTAEISYMFRDMVELSTNTISRKMLSEGYNSTTFENEIKWQLYKKQHSD